MHAKAYTDQQEASHTRTIAQIKEQSASELQGLKQDLLDANAQLDQYKQSFLTREAEHDAKLSEVRAEYASLEGEGTRVGG